MYKHILCPVDGSPTSNYGMHEAIRLAQDLHAHLRFIHIIDMYLPVLISSLEFSTVYVDGFARKNGKQILHHAMNIAKDRGVVSDSKMIESDGTAVATYIVNHAKEWPADLIVIGTHGLRGFDRLVMGSDAETVVRTSTVPVLLVKNPIPSQKD